MDKYIFNENNGLWYELVGDYYFPCLAVPAEEEQPVGVWGQRHKRYLKEHRPALYNALLLSGKLDSYLADIDQQAQYMVSVDKLRPYAACIYCAGFIKVIYYRLYKNSLCQWTCEEARVAAKKFLIKL